MARDDDNKKEKMTVEEAGRKGGEANANRPESDRDPQDRRKKRDDNDDDDVISGQKENIVERPRSRANDEKKQVYVPEWGKPGPQKGTAFGVAAAAQALQGLDFPVSKDDLLAKAEDVIIEYRKGAKVHLTSMIELMEDKEYPSMPNVLQEMGEALNRRRSELRSQHQGSGEKHRQPHEESAGSSSGSSSDKRSEGRKALQKLINLLTDEEFQEGLSHLRDAA